MKVNEVFCEDCLVTMARMPDCFVDLVVTSPPYDDLRKYKGYSFDFESVAKCLFRVMKDGGVVVWVVGDATIRGDETGTSFKQALYFKEVGFKLHDTMIYHKSDTAFRRHNHRKYPNGFDYMFVLAKSSVGHFNPIVDRRNKMAGARMSGTVRQRNGVTKPSRANGKVVSDVGIRQNVWSYSTGYGKSSSDRAAFGHPAIFPESLAEDHVLSWSMPGDLVYDPFLGSGTTAKVAKQNDRDYIGSEVSPEYIEIAKKRIEEARGSEVAVKPKVTLRALRRVMKNQLSLNLEG